jgi:hypothetical protein
MIEIESKKLEEKSINKEVKKETDPLYANLGNVNEMFKDVQAAVTGRLDGIKINDAQRLEYAQQIGVASVKEAEELFKKAMPKELSIRLLRPTYSAFNHFKFTEKGTVQNTFTTNYLSNKADLLRNLNKDPPKYVQLNPEMSRLIETDAQGTPIYDTTKNIELQNVVLSKVEVFKEDVTSLGGSVSTIGVDYEQDRYIPTLLYNTVSPVVVNSILRFVDSGRVFLSFRINAFDGAYPLNLILPEDVNLPNYIGMTTGSIAIQVDILALPRIYRIDLADYKKTRLNQLELTNNVTPIDMESKLKAKRSPIHLRQAIPLNSIIQQDIYFTSGGVLLKINSDFFIPIAKVIEAVTSSQLTVAEAVKQQWINFKTVQLLPLIFSVSKTSIIAQPDSLALESSLKKIEELFKKEKFVMVKVSKLITNVIRISKLVNTFKGTYVSSLITMNSLSRHCIALVADYKALSLIPNLTNRIDKLSSAFTLLQGLMTPQHAFKLSFGMLFSSFLFIKTIISDMESQTTWKNLYSLFSVRFMAFDSQLQARYKKEFASMLAFASGLLGNHYTFGTIADSSYFLTSVESTLSLQKQLSITQKNSKEVNDMVSWSARVLSSLETIAAHNHQLMQLQEVKTNPLLLLRLYKENANLYNRINTEKSKTFDTENFDTWKKLHKENEEIQKQAQSLADSEVNMEEGEAEGEIVDNNINPDSTNYNSDATVKVPKKMLAKKRLASQKKS